MDNVERNLNRLQERIAGAAQRAGRDEREITLVGVSKTQPVEVVLEAVSAGLGHLGENRVGELCQKRRQVEARRSFQPAPVWHMVGHIQSRKAAEVIGAADVIHSLDSLKLARRLERFAAEESLTLSVLLEVNVSGEESKYGLPAHHWRQDTSQVVALREIVEKVLQLPHLRLQGLMTIAPWVPNPDLIRSVFRSARLLLERLAAECPQADWRHLSMGMTDDFEIGIEEGATIVRIGRALFGPRRVTP